jgi:hypothetical protein
MLDPLWRNGPVGRVMVGAAEVSGGSVPNADRVVAGMRAGFRSCYSRSLVTRPDQRGSLRIVVRLNEHGGVTQAIPEGGRGLAQETIDCMLRRVQAASFNPPQGVDVVIAIPMTLDLVKEE